MKVNEFYLSLYKMFDNVTPLSKDCGILCGGACCEDEADEKKGMLLFPFEEKFLMDKEYEIIRSEWKYGEKEAYMLFCKGTCSRKYRPLSCRIFPLTPVVRNDGSIKLIMNPLAKGMCPLARSLKPSQLEPQFTENVQKALNRIAKIKGGKDFIKMLSDVAKDYNKL